MSDYAIASAMLRELERENAQLRVDIALARQVAMNWELEAHALRRELQSLRMDHGHDTERLNR